MTQEKETITSVRRQRTTLMREVERLTDLISDLEIALGTYAEHMDFCATTHGGDRCSCGLSAVYKSIVDATTKRAAEKVNQKAKKNG